MRLQRNMVAYFSMEIALEPGMPTYSGGLGVLAGDTLRAAADAGVPMVAVTLLHRKGYFRQHLDARGEQHESACEWSPETFLEPLEHRVEVMIQDRPVHVGAWRYPVRGMDGDLVPVYLLDTDLPENDSWDRTLTDHLYGGDGRYRLCQEVLLGLGGVAMLRSLGYGDLETYHMNEGHSALLGLALLEGRPASDAARAPTRQDVDAVRSRCVFTTHTPVAAGHDRFDRGLVQEVLGEERTHTLELIGSLSDGTLNMTYLALFFSHYVNGVSMRHEQVSQGMFPSYPVNSITNGVHATTWTSAPFQRLFDQHIQEWRRDNRYLRYAVGIPLEEIASAHREAKLQMLQEVGRRAHADLDPAVLTLGFARRTTQYKRAGLLLSEPERLRSIAQQVGPLRILYAGKAHPEDERGKSLIRQVFEAAAAVADAVPLIYLEEYDLELARLLCSGVDLWVNTPQRPYEASGTSGMKAALNGVPSLSILDGWWIEGHVEGATGWSIGETWDAESDDTADSHALFDKLELEIAPTFYQRPDAYTSVMRSAIAINGSFFNAQRMVSQYLEAAYASSGEI